MDKLNKEIKSTLIAAVCITCGLVIGIPLIPVGAVFRLWVVMGVGIALVIVGFYGTPLIWVSFAEKRSMRRLVIAIERENLYTVDEIARQIGRRPKDADKMISTAILKEYISGYKYNQGILTVNYNKKPENPYLGNVRCTYCGAPLTILDEGVTTCPYCGTIVKK